MLRRSHPEARPRTVPGLLQLPPAPFQSCPTQGEPAGSLLLLEDAVVVSHCGRIPPPPFLTHPPAGDKGRGVKSEGLGSLLVCPELLCMAGPGSQLLRTSISGLSQGWWPYLPPGRAVASRGLMEVGGRGEPAGVLPA